MKIIKNLLIVSSLVMLLCVMGRVTNIYYNSYTLLFFGAVFFVVASIVYGILSLKNKNSRIEAGMIVLALPFIIGVVFKLMKWPGGDVIVISWSGTLTMASIGVFIYTQLQNRKSALGFFYLAIGFGSLYFCFRIMRWPGATMLFIPFAVLLIAAIGYYIVKKPKFELSIGVVFVVVVLYVVVFLSKSSQLYRIQYINESRPEWNFPETYHEYAWLLYKEGKSQEAEANLQLAIQEALNPNGRLAKSMGGRDGASVERYKRAIDSLNVNRWEDIERPMNYPTK